MTLSIFKHYSLYSKETALWGLRCKPEVFQTFESYAGIVSSCYCLNHQNCQIYHSGQYKILRDQDASKTRSSELVPQMLKFAFALFWCENVLLKIISLQNETFLSNLFCSKFNFCLSQPNPSQWVFLHNSSYALFMKTKTTRSLTLEPRICYGF